MIDVWLASGVNTELESRLAAREAAAAIRLVIDRTYQCLKTEMKAPIRDQASIAGIEFRMVLLTKLERTLCVKSGGPDVAYNPVDTDISGGMRSGIDEHGRAIVEKSKREYRNGRGSYAKD